MVHLKRLLVHRLLTKVWAWLLDPRKNVEPTTDHQKKEDIGAKGRNCVCCCFAVTKSSPTLQPCGLQQASLLCPSLPPVVCSNSYPLSRWYYLTMSSSAASFSFCLQSFAASESFLSESALRIRWPKYWDFSFSISPFNEYSGLMSFKIG